MALKEKQTSLMASNNATYKTVEGVTYFKLKSEFEGDYTKHCGLLGEEIDENFYFLRGYDIESFEFDDKKNLIIQRVDKDYPPIVINMEDTIEHPTFEFDKKNGEIIVTYPDGTIKVMGGFFVEGRDIRIATDSTLNGDSTIYNPLRLSPTEATGTFAPADEYFDLTDGTKMPEGKGKGYRVVTREKIDNFGCLYPFDAVKKLQEKLTETGSQWRVPSKKDWDELLNALECPEDRNHSANTCTWLGRFAGAGLKSANLWKEHPTLPTEGPTNGQDVRGLTVYPLGITPDRNEILNDDNYDAEGFGKIAGMWTSTINDEGNAYVKMFGYNSAKVDQDTYGEGARMSIRLIKEYAFDNFNEIETILGFPYPTELVYGIHDDAPYIKIWTKINLYSDAETLGGIRSEEWSAVTDSDKGVKIIYFINEWDGTEWHKKPMENGDSVVIIDCEDKPYHEWRVIEGELIDTAEALIEEFEKDFTEVREDIAELSATTKELVQFSGWVVETINDFSAATEEHINRIDKTITEISGITTANIERIDKDVASVSGAVDTVSAITTSFSASTVAEIARLDGRVDELSATTEAFSASTVAEIARLDDRVDELSATTEAFSASTVTEIARLDDRVDEEAQARIDNDLTPGIYVLSGEPYSEMVIPTNSDKIADVRIKVSDDFFNFGEF